MYGVNADMQKMLSALEMKTTAHKEFFEKQIREIPGVSVLEDFLSKTTSREFIDSSFAGLVVLFRCTM